MPGNWKDGSDEAVANADNGGVREVRALLAVSEQDRNEAVAIWVPNQVFEKSDRKGGIPQGKSPFRFQPNISK
jgi:hypothetical protein